MASATQDSSLDLSHEDSGESARSRQASVPLRAKLALLSTAAFPPGIYRINSQSRPAAILETITDWGWYAGYINGREVSCKREFIRAVGRAMEFPSYVGQNWDAFEEALRDLNWIAAQGYVLLIDGLVNYPAIRAEEWQIALSILQHAIAFWESEGMPFYVLLRFNGGMNHQFPSLTAPL